MRPAPGPDRITQRLFFALWPDMRLQAALQQVGQSMQRAFHGRVVAARNIHLTLAFLGSVPVARVDELLAIGAAIAVDRFPLKLTETGCWKRSAVAWVAPEKLPQALENLVLGLRQRLLRSGFGVDEKPFSPHVTLLRKAKCRREASPDEVSLEWQVDSFALIRSDTLQTGPEYARLGTWPLM